MFSFLPALGLLVLIPIFIIAAIFDIFMCAIALGWRVLSLTWRIICAILGTIGVLLTLPVFICILLML